jgi:pimeloyl-ACP methyl ester carboxylesterase
MLGKMLTAATIKDAPALAERVRELMAATPVPGMVGALAAMRDRADSLDLLSTLQGMPALVLVGEEDQLSPPDRARAMADALRDARLVVIPGAAHLTTMERGERVTAAMRKFLKGL